MTSDELRTLAVELEVEASHARDAAYLRTVADEIDRLTIRVAELDAALLKATTPENMRIEDGVRYGDCPFCGMSVASHEDLEASCK